MSRSLDKKLLVLGFEIPDLLAVFLLLAALNFFLGGGGGATILLIWLPPLFLAIILRYGKRGKPDNYLLHVSRYYLSPGVYSAFEYPTVFKIPPSIAKDRE